MHAVAISQAIQLGLEASSASQKRYSTLSRGHVHHWETKFCPVALSQGLICTKLEQCIWRVAFDQE